MLYIASDHAGFELKQALVDYLKSKEAPLQDLGPQMLEPQDDYPDYVTPLAEKIREDPAQNKGILICRNGIGVTMHANRFKNVRAGLSWSPEHAQSGRQDDNTNVLALPAAYIDMETAKKIVDVWLGTDFSEDSRHARRLEKIER